MTGIFLPVQEAGIMKVKTGIVLFFISLSSVAYTDILFLPWSGNRMPVNWNWCVMMSHLLK